MGAREALRFEHLTAEEGLANSAVNALAQDGQGYVWIATPDGLSRFDGTTVDAAGRLWIGTRGGGLARCEAASDRNAVWRADENDPQALPADFVSALAFDSNGGIWVGMRTAGVAHMDLASGAFVSYPLDPKAPGTLRGRRVVFTVDESAPGDQRRLCEQRLAPRYAQDARLNGTPVAGGKVSDLEVYPDSFGTLYYSNELAVGSWHLSTVDAKIFGDGFEEGTTAAWGDLP